MSKRVASTRNSSYLTGKPAFLIGKRIYLWPLEMDDLETFYCWFNNPELRQYIQMPYPVSAEQERDFIEKAIKSTDCITVAIVLIKSDRLIGDLFISPVDKVHRRASIGIAIGDPGCLSLGYGTEAMDLILSYASNTLNIHRLELSVYSFNQRAIRCYKNLGFKHEGTSREAHFSHGQYHDVVQMGLLAAEWRRSS